MGMGNWMCFYNAGGDIEKLWDELLALCDKLKEGDIDKNVRHLKYKIETLSKSATEQMKEKAESEETPLVDTKKRLPSPTPPQPGTAEETKITKIEPASSSMITPTEATALSKPSESRLHSTLLFTIYSCYQEGTSSKRSGVYFHSCWYVKSASSYVCVIMPCVCYLPLLNIEWLRVMSWPVETNTKFISAWQDSLAVQMCAILEPQSRLF